MDGGKQEDGIMDLWFSEPSFVIGAPKPKPKPSQDEVYPPLQKNPVVKMTTYTGMQNSSTQSRVILPTAKEALGKFFYFKNKRIRNTLFLPASGSGEDSSLVLTHEIIRNNDEMLWKLMPTSEKGVFLIANKNTGHVLEMQDALIVKNATKVFGKANLNKRNQQWKFVMSKKYPTYFHIINMKTGTCIDCKGGSNLNGNRTQGWRSANDHWNQIFKLVAPEDAVTWPKKYYFLIQNKASGNVIELPNGDNANGTELRAVKRDKKDYNFNQLWKKTTPKKAPGLYIFTHKRAKDNAMEYKKKIVMNRTKAKIDKGQLWQLMKCQGKNEGYFHIVNPKNQKCIEENTENGDVRANELNKADHQMWKFIHVTDQKM